MVYNEETMWLTQQQLCELYQTSKSNVSEHIKHIFEDEELSREATVRNSEQFKLKEPLPRYLRPITARVVETFLANNIYQQLQFCFAYSSCNEGFFVLHYVLCDFVCVTANFLGFVIVFYCLLVVLCYPFYMCGIEVVLEGGVGEFHEAPVVSTGLVVLAGDE